MSFRIVVAEFLQTVIVSNEFIHLDLWSVVHFGAGMLLGFIIAMLIGGFFKKLFTVGFVLGAWEVFEYVMYGVIKSPYFRPESVIDVITDLWVGLLGAFIILVIIELVGGSKRVS